MTTSRTATSERESPAASIHAPTLGIDDYVSMDVRLGWSPNENLSLEIVGQNLLDQQRLEFAPSFVNFIPTQVERGVYGKVTWRF